MIRGAFKRAVMELENGGRPLSSLIKDSLEDDVKGTLQAMKGFVPKELDVTAVEVPLEDWLDALDE
jgi:hypothetical protein